MPLYHEYVPVMVLCVQDENLDHPSMFEYWHFELKIVRRYEEILISVKFLSYAFLREIFSSLSITTTTTTTGTIASAVLLLLGGDCLSTSHSWEYIYIHR
jgi:hypothetical protein